MTSPMTEQQWTDKFTADHGREPTLSEYRAAKSAGEFSEPAATAAPGTAFPNRLRGMPAVYEYLPLILAGLGFFAVLCLFLPVLTALGESANWFSTGLKEEGYLLLVSFLLLIGAGALLWFKRLTWVRMTAGGLAVLVGILATLDGFANINRLSNTPWVSPGIGLYIIGLLGLAMIAGGVLCFLPAAERHLGQGQQRHAVTKPIA